MSQGTQHWTKGRQDFLTWLGLGIDYLDDDNYEEKGELNKRGHEGMPMQLVLQSGQVPSDTTAHSPP